MSDQWYPQPDQAQIDLQEEQERKVAMSLPVLQDVLDWYDQQIATYQDPMTIMGVNPSTPAEDVKSAVLFARTLVDEYQRKRVAFANQFSKYLKEDADEA